MQISEMVCKSVLWVLLLLVLSQFSSAVSHENREVESLMAFKSIITADPHRSLANWNPTSKSFCNWTGITCNKRDTSVLAINLTGRGLVGALSPFLGNLSSLQLLDLSKNSFHGHIPLELGALSMLQYLNVGQNSFDGAIPFSITNLSSLVTLELSENKLSGHIPAQLDLITRLQFLRLDKNAFTGAIPSSFSNLSHLEELAVDTNSLSGQIPWELGSKLSNLSVLKLFSNQLSGNIPKSIGNCSKLTKLVLSGNQLSGRIPLELGKLSLLERLKLHLNQLDCGRDPNMPLITALVNCSNLKQLTLGDNKLSGVLPNTIGGLSPKLDLLYLTNNSIYGSIPPGIGNLTSLTFLALNRNLLTGTIPSLERLTILERLQLQRNRLQGPIPEKFSQLKYLGLLDLSFNNLSGPIPESLGSLEQLRRVYLHHNQFSGSIPSNLGDCKNLEKLDLSYNRLNGNIPKEVGRLSHLQFYLNLSSNLLEGPLPAEIGNLEMVIAMDFSANRLTNKIPPAIGSCSGLQYLNLSNNGFGGQIPSTIRNLKYLIQLDLSHNNLSGKVPLRDLKNLTTIELLDLSYNNLSGEIPEGYITGNHSAIVSLIGNPNLCGPSKYSLHFCLTQKADSRRKVLLKVLLSILGVVALLLCIVAVALFRRTRQRPVSSRTSFYEVGSRRLSYAELFEATTGFAQETLLGKGSFGSVYRGILSDGSMVAVKVLHRQNAHVNSSFKTECKVLQQVRHRNLVRVLAFCSKPNFQALVFQFMPNGSLEKLLYPEHHDSSAESESSFGLLTRLNIATDMAFAIEYLHHDCFSQVIHRDIKPANVLLDEEMTAHITDFGVSRSTDTSSAAPTISTAAMKGTTGYIAPEYGLEGTLSTKGDVYSFGITLLEMLTRKRPTDEVFHGDLSLHQWVSSAYPNRLKSVIDNKLMDDLQENNSDEFSAKFKCILGLCQVGLLCSNYSPHDRPTMRDVSRALQRLKEGLKDCS